MKPSLAAISAQIGASTRPQIYEPTTTDWGKAVNNFLDSYQKAQERGMTQEAWQREKDEQDRYNAFRQEYGDAIARGDVPGSLAAIAKSDPFKHWQITTELENTDKKNKLAWAQLAFEKDQLEKKMARESMPSTDKIRNYEYFSKIVGPDKATEIIFPSTGTDKNAPSNIFERKRIENIAKNADKNIETAENRISDFQRAKDLLDRGLETGGIWGYAKSKTNPALLDKNSAEFQSIVSRIVPQMRPAGSGTTSDRDMAIFEKATIGLNKPKETNSNIINAQLLANQNTKAREELRADWISSGRSLSDFDKEWRNYVNDNPIFNSSGDYSLNANRVDPYAYFAGERKQNNNSQGGASGKNNDPLGIR